LPFHVRRAIRGCSFIVNRSSDFFWQSAHGLLDTDMNVAYSASAYSSWSSLHLNPAKCGTCCRSPGLHACKPCWCPSHGVGAGEVVAWRGGRLLTRRTVGVAIRKRGQRPEKVLGAATIDALLPRDIAPSSPKTISASASRLALAAPAALQALEPLSRSVRFS
jgi:hypothetical protein